VFPAFIPAVTLLSSMAAAKEKGSSRLTAWLAPILFLLAAVVAAGPASALTRGALETRAWEKTPAPLDSCLDESLQLLNLHQQNDVAGYDDALGSPLAAEGEGTQVYRVWGDGSGPNGNYWTTTDPSTVSDFRSAAGLPEANSGRFVSEGILTDTNGVTFTPGGAASGAGGPGGLPEVVIPDPANQVQLTNVSGANPPF